MPTQQLSYLSICRSAPCLHWASNPGSSQSVRCGWCHSAAAALSCGTAHHAAAPGVQATRDRSAVKTAGGKIIRVEAHPIPEHPRPKRVQGRAGLVGDAAGYVTKCSGAPLHPHSLAHSSSPAAVDNSLDAVLVAPSWALTKLQLDIRPAWRGCCPVLSMCVRVLGRRGHLFRGQERPHVCGGHR